MLDLRILDGELDFVDCLSTSMYHDRQHLANLALHCFQGYLLGDPQTAVSIVQDAWIQAEILQFLAKKNQLFRSEELTGSFLACGQFHVFGEIGNCAKLQLLQR